MIPGLILEIRNLGIWKIGKLGKVTVVVSRSDLVSALVYFEGFSAWREGSRGWGRKRSKVLSADGFGWWVLSFWRWLFLYEWDEWDEWRLWSL